MFLNEVKCKSYSCSFESLSDFDHFTLMCIVWFPLYFSSVECKITLESVDGVLS